MSSLFAKGAAVWTVTAVGLLGVIVHQVADDRPTLSNVRAAPAGAPVDEETVAGDVTTLFPSEDLIAEIVARPLFFPSRRPALIGEDQQPQTVDPPDDKPVLELIGTILVGDLHIALLKHPIEGLIRRKPGESIGDWTLLDIGNQRVSLLSEDGQEILTLRKDLTKPPKPKSPSKPDLRDETKGQAKEPAKTPIPVSEPIRKRI